MKNIVFIFLCVVSFSYGQEHVNTLIDSLNFVSNSEKKIGLCKRIAVELTNKDWDRAISYLDLAKSEVENTSNPEQELASIYIAMGDVFSSKDVLDVTLEYYLKAYEILKDINNEVQVSILENNLAIIYARLKNKEKALEYFKNVYKYQLKNKDSLRLAQILNNIGTLYIETNADSSLYYFNKSLDISKQLHNKQLFVYNYTNLGRVHIIKNDIESAKDNLNKALEIINDSTDTDVKIFTYNSLAKFYETVRSNDSAIFYANKSINLGKGNYYSFSNLTATRILYQAYKAKNDFEESVNYFEKYNTIRDSLNVEEKVVNVERLKLQHEYMVKEQFRTFKEEKRRSNTIVVGLSLVAGILFLIIILIRYRNKITKGHLEKQLLIAQQNELHQKLKNKNKVLISKAMSEMHRTDIINGILNDLKTIKRKAVKKETQNAIDYILQNLQRDLNTNVWEEFEISFEQVHESFCKALNHKHPDLTPKDRRLCSLLYLDLTSKEIALITGQTFKSVENARTRLRKKLNLTKEKINLSSYMNSLH